MQARRIVLPVCVAAVIAVVALGAGEARANHVACGDTITADTTLDSDLVNCPNNGIVIGADNVTLDLNGHLIDGDGTKALGCDPNVEVCDAGVVDDGHDGVTVKRGRVREFAIGVLFGTSAAGKVRHNRVLGISSSKNFLFGFVLASSARSLVRNSSGNGNLAPEGDGMGLFASHHVRIVNNAFRRNALGIHVEDSTDNLIKGNVFSRNSDFGIFLQADRNQVRRNRCVRNGTCLIVGPGNRNVIARNRVFGGESGIGVEQGRGNLVLRNVVVHPRGKGIYLGLKSPSIGGSHTVVRGNRVRGSGGDGFQVNRKDGHSRLTRNVAISAGDDGFDIESLSATLTANRARRNADLGIEALSGVLDGGGNIARHNGDPRQCTHISCR
jgi:parallel beta-helix repeat protein